MTTTAQAPVTMRQVEIPHDYFYKMSKKDYSNFELALIREFYQNSYDAGANQFVVDYTTDEGVLTIFDDGSGMDYDTIVNKLLVMGLSHKTSENAVGAFGHAKILLYFSWDKWEIRTRNYLVSGSSHYYTIEEIDDYVDGTISTIHIKDQVSNFKYWTEEFFKWCQTNCKVFLSYNGVLSEIEQSYATTELIYTDENYNIYKSDQRGWYIYVRQNGVFMFREWINSSSDTTQAIVEINKKPEMVFLQNRDYFNSSIKDQFNKIKQEFAVDSVETFTLNHNTKAKYQSFEFQKTTTKNNGLVNEIEFDVLTYEMDEQEARKELRKTRTIRLVAIAYAFMSMLTEKFQIGTYKIGITKSASCIGRFRGKDDISEIYFNLNALTDHSPNYRKMAVLLLNTLKHELAHAVIHQSHGEASHNENFVRCHDNIHDTFWDIIPFINKFKEIWKESGK